MPDSMTSIAEAPVSFDALTTKVFADGADLEQILKLAANPRVKGFTTNPSLMWKAGLTDYTQFAKRLLEKITDHPVSFEVFADHAREIRRQARNGGMLGEPLAQLHVERLRLGGAVVHERTGSLAQPCSDP